MFFKKYKIYVIIFVLILGLFALLIFLNKYNKIYLNLEGEESVIIVVGEDYVEPGFNARDSKGNDLTKDVSVTTDLDIFSVGKYKIIYKIKDIVLERTVIVKNNELSINLIGEKNIYLLVGDDYIEPGYTVTSNLDNISLDDVVVTGLVNTFKEGKYEIKYSVDTDRNYVVVTRNIFVIDLNLSFEFDKGYTNNDVVIKYSIDDEYLDYILLPDNTKVSNSSGTYTIRNNGEYKFIVYGGDGLYKENIISIKNIDRVLPSGSCVIKRKNNNTIISIDASDNVGIDKYIYNDKTYKENEFIVSSSVKDASVSIFDVSGNSNEISCRVVPNVYINSVKKNGVIVSIGVYEFINKVAGYYFSYNNIRPNKNNGGYIATDETNIDVVRLPGTTYVWVEDSDGNISDYRTINISNNDILITTDSEYKLLENKRLDDFLISKGSSISELNKIISNSVLAAGLYTKEAAATSALSLQVILAQKYKIRIPYFNGGKSYDIGADGDWGRYKYGKDEYRDKEYFYDGVDCMGFTTWAYVNAGYDIFNSSNKYGSYFGSWWSGSVGFENGEVGDILVNNDNRNVRHVKIIIGKTDNGYITAEATSSYGGMVIRTHLFSKSNNYKVEKFDIIMKDYNKISKNNYLSGK